jgi:putative membrane protein
MKIPYCMKTHSANSTLPIRPLLTLTIGCALACLPVAFASAQDVGPAPVGSPGPSVAPEAATPAATEAALAATAGKLSKEEMKFIKKAGAGNAAEAKLGELAAANGESQEVKDFGTKMTKDHGDANTDLEPIAKAHGIEFPPAEKEKQKAMYEKLSKLKGKAFDEAYVKGMVTDHEKDLAEYKAEMSEAKDPELKAYVEKTEPVVAEHLKMIKEIQSKMMGEKKS